MRDDVRYCKCAMLYPYLEEGKQVFHMFMCGHVYHEKCLAGKENAPPVFECKECNKSTLELSKLELKRAA